MTKGCNIWMICWKLNGFLYGLSRMLQFSQFVWTLRYSVWDVFNNFLLIDATDRSKIRSDQKRFFIALSLYPLSFFANTPFNLIIISIKVSLKSKIIKYQIKLLSEFFLKMPSFWRKKCFKFHKPLTGGGSYCVAETWSV